MREHFRRYHYFYKKLHSFTGVVPLGAFLIEHLWTNAHAIRGAAVFDAAARYLESLPFLIWIEAFFIWAPLFYHAIYGVAVLRISHLNNRTFPYWRNWLFTLQRITGVIALIFIGYHFYEFRLANYIWGRPINFVTVHQDLHQPLMAAFYALGILAVVYHFANGLWSAGIDWGFLVSPRAQNQFTWVSAAIFLVVGTLGIGALIAFAR